MSKPSRKRHPEGQPKFRRRFTSVYRPTILPYRSWETVSDDAPLTPEQASHWRWLVLGVVALGLLALIFLGH